MLIGISVSTLHSGTDKINHRISPWFYLILFEIDLDQDFIYSLTRKITKVIKHSKQLYIHKNQWKTSPVFVHVSLENITIIFPIPIFFHF